MYETDSSQWPDVWQAAYKILEETIIETQLKMWIQPIQFLRLEPGPEKNKIHLGIVNEFSMDWVSRNHRTPIEAAFAQVTGKPCELVLELVQNAAPVSAPYEMTSESIRPSAPSVSQQSMSTPGSGNVITSSTRSQLDSHLDSRFIFESFVVGASNELAHASARAVAAAPGRQYPVLFLYSAPGLGKTHLLHAIGNHILATNPKARITYLTGERFMNELIESIQMGRTKEFRDKFRQSYDCILMDDIQFIAGKEKTEEEFFHTFNDLYSSKRQIVVTSDRPPSEIAEFTERIRSRFERGLVADIQPPEIETRIAILKTKAERDDLYLPDEVATFLATFIKSSVRQLEGILVRLGAQASLTGAEISLEMAKQVLKEGTADESSNFTVESIQSAVCKHFNIKATDLKSESRQQRVALPRQIAMYLIRKYTGSTFDAIGGFFGGKDHTTIRHACTKIEAGIESDLELRNSVEKIQNLL